MARDLSTLQIGYIVAEPGAPMTGSERYYFDLLRALPGVGVSSSGLVVGEPRGRAGDAVGDHANVENFAPEPGGGSRGRIRNLRRAVRRIAPTVDLVATHSPEHAFPVLDLLRKKPLVVHFHGPRFLEYIAEKKSLRRIATARVAETFTYARAARFIVLSQAFADILNRHYHVSSNRIRIVPGAVDQERFRPSLSREQARAKLGWPQDRLIALAVRRLAPTKGIENLIDAIVLVRRKIPNVFLALVGTGPLANALRDQVNTLGLSDTVRFEGRLDEELLPHAYRAADLSIVPTVDLEGFGLSVVESLACGTPALVTPVTGLPEVVRDLDERLILSGYTPSDLADGLIRAFTAPEQLPTAEACLAHANGFAWTSIVARIKAVYEEALNESRSHR